MALLFDKVRDIAQSYFVQGELLVRKWVPCDGDFVGKEIFQVVLLSHFRKVLYCKLCMIVVDICG